MTLSEYLEQQKTTAAEFGRKAGLSRSAVGRLAKGERHPSPDVMRRIIAATDGAVQPNDFFEPQALAAQLFQMIQKGAR